MQELRLTDEEIGEIALEGRYATWLRQLLDAQIAKVQKYYQSLIEQGEMLKPKPLSPEEKER